MDLPLNVLFLLLSFADSIFTPLLGFGRRQEEQQEEHSAITNLLEGINPIDSENWSRKSIFGKAYEIFKVGFGVKVYMGLKL